MTQKLQPTIDREKFTEWIVEVFKEELKGTPFLQGYTITRHSRLEEDLAFDSLDRLATIMAIEEFCHDQGIQLSVNDDDFERWFAGGTELTIGNLVDWLLEIILPKGS